MREKGGKRKKEKRKPKLGKSQKHVEKTYSNAQEVQSSVG